MATARPTLILLVRHGTTATTGKVLPGRAPGLHLADKGLAQAEAVAGRIAALKRVAAVYASPMERTQETAKPIARELGHRVRTHHGLNECDFGDWTGKRLADLRRRRDWRRVQRHPSGFRFPRGESFAEMQLRIVGALADVHHRNPGDTIVAVSHADPIKAAVAHAVGTHLDLFQRIVVSPCSVTALLWSDDGPMVLAVSSTAALTELGGG
jgi:probable phosphoglycerate mutase